MKTQYKTPILTSVFQIFAALFFLAAVFVLIVGFAGSSRETPAYIGVGVAVALAFSGLVYLGIGQAVEYLARSAYHNERTADATDLMAAQLRQTAKIQAAATKPLSQRLVTQAPTSDETDPDIAEHLARKAARGT